MKLVYVNNNRLVTDSLTIAEMFDKEHARVLRDIRELGCSEAFRVGNFADTPYVNEQNGQTYSKYILTEQGFMILVMSYTGSRAFEIKEAYIAEFDRMKDQLNKPQHQLPQNYKEALLALVIQVEKTELLEAKVKENEPKVALYDVAMQAQNAQPMNSVAKTLGIGRNKLFLVLREKKVLMHNNLPYQEFLDRGYFEVRQYSITHLTSGIENKVQTLVTPKGMAHIHKLIQTA